MEEAPKSVFITAGNRGLGFEFVKQFLALTSPPEHVFAACRTPEKATALQQLAVKHSGLKIIKYDALDSACLPLVEKVVAEAVGNQGLNMLLNVVGILEDPKLATLEVITADMMMNSFQVNAVSPLMLSQVLLPHLKRAAVVAGGELSHRNAMIVNISGTFGSIGENSTGGRYAIRAAKSALNAISRNMSFDLLPHGIMVLCIHPGVVSTDMVGPSAPLDPPTSISSMMKVIATATKEDCSRFLDYKHDLILW